MGIENPDTGSFKNRMQELAFDEEDKPEDLSFRSIAAGENQSFAVTKTGKLYSWGFGTQGALCHGEDEDETRPRVVTKFNDKKDARRILQVSGGSQHTIVLVQKNLNPSKF